VGIEVILAQRSACHTPVTTVSYTAIAVGINGGYDRYLPVECNAQTMVRVDFPSGCPLQVGACASVVEMAGFQRP